MKTIIILLSILSSSIVFAQEQSLNLRVDSLLFEGANEYQIPEKEMHVDISDGKMQLSGYNIFMEEKESTVYKLAQEFGNGSDNGDYIYFRVNMYYNNPVPDNDLEIYQFKNGIYKLIISSAAMITELYCISR